ncbi:MAG: SpoIIE family protein phosphatase [Planctomycetes bacterium]|nr:SpoIIE family protein phosphatase [Planctomycetota bacterium]MBI3833510.1 SpoIIE family protein phosphatase [Planctomycetota bacterium]
MAYLRYIDDAGRLESKLLDVEQFLIGRANTCQLFFESDMISREHLRIDLEADGRHRVRDLGSRNKTYVNGELVNDTLLTNGDIIRVGDRVVEFIDDAARPEVGELDFLVAEKSDPPDCEWVKLKLPVSLTLAQVESLSLLCSEMPLTARAEDIANAALGQIILDVQAERGFIALRGEGKSDLRPLAQRAMKRVPGASLMAASQNFVLAPVLQNVAGRYPQSAGQINAKLAYATVGLVAPLTFRGDVVGVLYADRPSSKKPFPPASLQYALAAGAYIGAMVGETARKLPRSAVREGAAWMSAIRRVQATLTTPVTSSDTFDVVSKLYPGRYRCGDFALVMHLDESRCAMLVIDGGGHGMPGIALSASLQAAVRSALAANDETLLDPSGMFNSLNQTIAQAAGRQVLPCTYVGIDISAGRLAYINAGGVHPMLLVAPGRLVALEQPSLALGVDREYLYEASRVELPDAFRMICCTEGIVGAVNAAGESVGAPRVHEALLPRESFASATEVVGRVGNVWVAHLASTQSDDDALVLVLSRGTA